MDQTGYEQYKKAWRRMETLDEKTSNDDQLKSIRELLVKNAKAAKD